MDFLKMEKRIYLRESMSEVQRRIVIDRVYLTLQIPSLFSELGNGFDKRLYEELRDDDVKSKFL